MLIGYKFILHKYVLYVCDLILKGVADCITMSIKSSIILRITGTICEHNKQNYGKYSKE